MIVMLVLRSFHLLKVVPHNTVTNVEPILVAMADVRYMGTLVWLNDRYGAVIVLDSASNVVENYACNSNPAGLRWVEPKAFLNGRETSFQNSKGLLHDHSSLAKTRIEVNLTVVVVGMDERCHQIWFAWVP